jgi:hypothetical protein
MRPFNEIEKLIRRGEPSLKTGEKMDKQTLEDSYAAMEEIIEPKSRDNKSGILRLVVQKRVTKLIAAAVIILSIGIFIILNNPDTKVENADVNEFTQSPADMQSLLSLNIAYRRGGIDAVERQSEKATEMLGPRPAEMTIRQILTEFNGT